MRRCAYIVFLLFCCKAHCLPGEQCEADLLKTLYAEREETVTRSATMFEQLVQRHSTARHVAATNENASEKLCALAGSSRASVVLIRDEAADAKDSLAGAFVDDA